MEKAELKNPPLSGEIKLNNQDKEDKFVPPKMEVLESEQKQKPIFVKTEEANIPQPSQLTKKPKPLFENKTNSDDLLGDGIL